MPRCVTDSPEDREEGFSILIMVAFFSFSFFLFPFLPLKATKLGERERGGRRRDEIIVEMPPKGGSSRVASDDITYSYFSRK